MRCEVWSGETGRVAERAGLGPGRESLSRTRGASHGISGQIKRHV